ncbi:hypothetical protein GI584_18575 [Gracilibacillus salitolerans]|uniref:Uncharacterized protein n=1 Tax=Gracilibacillus salitolerans TaxID=2663022 RepID=A0A5Q2TP98_9BACI|nr:hypothetical protein GI584_18575 [Gracilibacillus salitolerans]
MGILIFLLKNIDKLLAGLVILIAQASATPQMKMEPVICNGWRNKT